MCGISGIVGNGATEPAVRAMVSVQHHRGPDENGIYVDAGGQVVLGHNRLRIIDLSPAGRQPMSNPDGSLWLVFNGEIYNYRELRQQLSDYPYRTATDSEVILAAYEEWGEACVEHFVGMFAFALFDRRNNRLFCARDRIGVKPFVYGWHEGRFYFASEAKALFAAGFPCEPDDQSWATYLVHSYTDHDDRTFFRGIRALPPGNTLAIGNGKEVRTQYWDLPAISHDIEPIGDDRAIAKFDELFDEALRLRLRSDVTLGINLTGGIDSSAMMVTADRLLSGQGTIETFTASYNDARYDEQEFASDVPRRNEWRRNVKPMGAKEAWDLLDEAVWHQEAPFGAVATLGYHNLLKYAKASKVTVLLEGQGVDEMLAGYEYFRFAYYQDLVSAGDHEVLHREMSAAGDPEAATMKKLHSLATGASMNVYQDGTSHLRPDCVSAQVREKAGALPTFSRPFDDNLRNALYRDFRHTKLPRVLRMNDRLSMASSRELRVVYLDHRLVEFLFTLPANLRIRDGQRKFLLRTAMKGRLPDSIRLTPKRAVVTPQREWFVGPLKDQIEDVISSRSFRERGIFDAKAVAEEFKNFCAGQGNNAFYVWQWINTELWYRRFSDSRSPATSK